MQHFDAPSGVYEDYMRKQQTQTWTQTRKQQPLPQPHDHQLRPRQLQPLQRETAPSGGHVAEWTGPSLCKPRATASPSWHNAVARSLLRDFGRVQLQPFDEITNER